MFLLNIQDWGKSYANAVVFFFFFSSFLGLDFLTHLNSVFPPRKHPGASSTSILHSSPLNVFMGSPGKEENENHDLIAESKKTYLGKQEPKDSFKQVSA